MKPEIKISDYTYILPEEKIARYPLAERDSSKLLVYKNGSLSDDNFYNLERHLPSNSFMVFNNTKVVPARLFFKKTTGAVIEILCLNPVSPKEYVLSFASKHSCDWNAVLGNAKRWKDGDIQFFAQNPFNLRAELIQKKEENGSVVRFKWDTDATFSEVLDHCGQVPIPPYLNRKSEEIDKTRYQTVYAKVEGSVAAPTAGLHFTERVLKSIDAKGIKRDEVCLHVGAGTFIPVKSEFITDHRMHTEPFSVSRQFLQDLASLKEGEKVISVGTTSTRCLESLYFTGVQCIEAEKRGESDSFVPEVIAQWEPYGRPFNYSVKEAAEAMVRYLERNNLQRLVTGTSIIIVPGYHFHVVDIQITNFHQPQSTLLLLIAAIIGDDWKKVYRHALDSGYRFLSYGDSSILFRDR